MSVSKGYIEGLNPRGTRYKTQRHARRVWKSTRIEQHQKEQTSYLFKLARPTKSNMSLSKVVLVSGANQGLGFEVVHVTALREPASTYILACRNTKAGEEAVHKLRELGVKSELEVIELDVTNDSQIEAAVKHVESKYGKLDSRSKGCQIETASLAAARSDRV